MELLAEKVNFFASLGVVAIQVFLLLILGLWLWARAGKSQRAEGFLLNIGQHGLVIAFVIALSAVITSLIYSELLGYEPCKLCWVQRIFLYPQVIILGLAIWKKTRDAVIYCLVLSIIGGIIGLYHYYGQMFNPAALAACGADGTVSCAVRFFVEFGYITIPMMSLTTFLALAVLMSLNRNYSQEIS